MKGLQCAGLQPYYSNILSDDKFLPSIHYTKGDSEAESYTSVTPEQTATVPSASLLVQSRCLWDVQKHTTFFFFFFFFFLQTHTQSGEISQKKRGKARTPPFKFR
jgi:hypothetical protein